MKFKILNYTKYKHTTKHITLVTIKLLKYGIRYGIFPQIC